MIDQDKSRIDYEKIDRAWDALLVMDYVWKTLTKEELLAMREGFAELRKRKQEG